MNIRGIVVDDGQIMSPMLEKIWGKSTDRDRISIHQGWPIQARITSLNFAANYCRWCGHLPIRHHRGVAFPLNCVQSWQKVPVCSSRSRTSIEATLRSWRQTSRSQAGPKVDWGLETLLSWASSHSSLEGARTASLPGRRKFPGGGLPRSGFDVVTTIPQCLC